MPGPIEAIHTLSETERRWDRPDPSEEIRDGRWVLQSVSNFERHARDLERPLCGSQETIPPIFLLLNPSDAPDPDIPRPVSLTCVRQEINPPGFRGRVYQAKIEFSSYWQGYHSYPVGFFLLPQGDPRFLYRFTPYWTADPEKWQNTKLQFPVTAASLGTNIVHGILFDLRQLRKNVCGHPEDLEMVAFPVFPNSDYSQLFDPQTGRLIITPVGNNETRGAAPDASSNISPEDLAFLEKVLTAEGPYTIRYITNQNRFASKKIPIPIIISGDPDAAITTSPSRDPGYEILRVISTKYNRTFKGNLSLLHNGSVILNQSSDTAADFNQFPDQSGTKALIITFKPSGMHARAITLPILPGEMTLDSLELYLLKLVKSKTDRPASEDQPKPQPVNLPRSGTVYEAPRPKTTALENLLNQLKDFPPGVFAEGLQQYYAEIPLQSDAAGNVRFPVSVNVNRDGSRVILEIRNLPLKGVATERTSLRMLLRSITKDPQHILHTLTIRIKKQKNAAPVIETTARRLTTGQETRLGAVSDDQTRLEDLLSRIEPPEYANRLTPLPERRTPQRAKKDQITKRGKPNKHHRRFHG